MKLHTVLIKNEQEWIKRMAEYMNLSEQEIINDKENFYNLLIGRRIENQIAADKLFEELRKPVDEFFNYFSTIFKN